MRQQAVRELLELGLAPCERKLNARLIEELAKAFGSSGAISAAQALPPPGPPGGEQAGALLSFLQLTIEQGREQFEQLRRRHADFVQRCAGPVNADEQGQVVLDYARDLGASWRQLRGDRKAFARWFGPDAVTDRYLRRRVLVERKIAFCLRQVGALAARMLKDAGTAAQQEGLWRCLGLEKTARPLLTHEGDHRVATAAFRCLSEALHAVAHEASERLVGDDTLAFIYRAALDARLPVWTQCEAISLLQHLSPTTLVAVLETRLTQPGEGDDLFVRRRAVQVLGENLHRLPELDRLVPALVRDPSPFVRQGLARALARAVTAREGERLSWLRRLAREDPVAQVRAAAVWEALALTRRTELAGDYLALLVEVIDQESDAFVLRVALHAAAEAALVLAGDPLWRSAIGELRSAIARTHTRAESLAVRRWAVQAWERIWCATDPRARALRDALEPELRSLTPGSSRRFSRRWFGKADEALVGRVLAVLAQDDFGYDLQWRWWGARITRGPVFRFRLWRLWHEMRHPDPAKRQAFPHTIGRSSAADVRAPSAILAELAQTKVPGEPLFLASEAGWRPYLPLVDDVLSCLNRGMFARPVRFYTSEGVTELTPPRFPLTRLWAYLKLNVSFTHYAQLRNWQEGGTADPSAYGGALERLGFRLSFRPHADEQEEAGQNDEEPPTEPSLGPRFAVDPAVTRFFPAVPVLGPDLGTALYDLFVRFSWYFTSVFENSLPELVVFLVLLGAFFLVRAWYWTFSLRRARRRFALVLGGWGTRGKSGTERLKAALVEALGHSLISKTTGCEAMFLHAQPYSPTREMFLYRSYDKATIWEQRMVVRLADRLGAEVFLWECMGLTPAYVEVLQQHWMRDDLSTLTNTYPDHEDIQGPAGRNIPEVMTRFIPRRARLLTSEEQMRPILHEAAARRGTSFRAVGWLEAGLLPPDVLQRFPYEEHPYNIALVLALAEELGVGSDFALKEMADRVVPDLGVLKTSPVARVRGRRLQFSNGMSANERHGCLSNWSRLGFDRQDPEAEPGTWLSTVVNNRADRIPRSRVFAGVLVNDLAADRHFLIGGNLTGLVGYLREAWDEQAAQWTLWPETGQASPVQVLEAAARRFRRPVRGEAIRARLRAMLLGLAEDKRLPAGLVDALAARWDDLEGLGEQLRAAELDDELREAVVAHLKGEHQALAEYRALAGRLDSSEPTQRAELDGAFRALLWRWFESKLVVIADYYATGEQIVDRIRAETPPGVLNRVMGIQNIKGTGLDFVYRWEGWHACHRACVLLRDPSPARAEKGLRELTAFQEFGLLSEEFVRQTIDAVRQTPFAQQEEVRSQLEMILSRLEAQLGAVRERLKGGAQTRGWRAGLAAAVEALLDASDALRRRKRADQIYADLSTQRISHERAALELQALNKRQKGGWLLRKK